MMEGPADSEKYQDGNIHFNPDPHGRGTKRAILNPNPHGGGQYCPPYLRYYSKKRDEAEVKFAWKNYVKLCKPQELH
jgi:hypothetical protein